MLANTRAALMRDAPGDRDTLGDEVETFAPVADWDDFPAGITERGDEVFDEASGTQRIVKRVTGRVPYGIPVQPGDRIRDNVTGNLYIIDETQRQRRSISGRSSVTLTLRDSTG